MKVVMVMKWRQVGALTVVRQRIGCFLLAVSLLLSANGALSIVSAQSVLPTTASLMYAQQSAKRYQPNVLDIKIQPNSGVRLVNGAFVGGDRTQTAQLNAIVREPRTTIAARAGEQAITGGGPASQSVAADAEVSAAVSAAVGNYYRITFNAGTNVQATAAQLSALSADIAYAYPAVLPAPAPTVPLYTSLQSYDQAAPVGVDTPSTVKFLGSQGGAVNLVDIEYSWNTAHADLSKARTAVRANGTPVDPFQDNNHGTAVLGELVADSNAYGVTGIVPNANLSLINVDSAEYGYDPAGALLSAAKITKPGDVVLIEQQAYGPTGYDYVPVEWIPEVYDAIRALTSHGVTVVEPAGNGGESLDNPAEFGGSFPLGQPSSGALIVGAGENCAGSPAHSWLGFSDYGQRVDLQGPGDCVVTTGYGDLYDAAGSNNTYTSSFNGTSSASPVVAAAAVALSSAYKRLNNGAVLTPATIVSILKATGTAQSATTIATPSTKHIGPLPNLAKALLSTDNTPPSAVSPQIRVSVAGQVQLSWKAASDNVQVVSYRIYRNGIPYRLVSADQTTFTDTAVVRGHAYGYQIYAIDEAGHHTALSKTVLVRLP